MGFEAFFLLIKLQINLSKSLNARYGATDFVDEAGWASFEFALGCSFGRRGMIQLARECCWKHGHSCTL